jgi:hypothetical protein
MPGSGVWDGELVEGGEFEEPAVHLETELLDVVFYLAGAFAEALDAVDFVHEGVGYEG